MALHKSNGGRKIIFVRCHHCQRSSALPFLRPRTIFLLLSVLVGSLAASCSPHSKFCGFYQASGQLWSAAKDIYEQLHQMAAPGLLSALSEFGFNIPNRTHEAQSQSGKHSSTLRPPPSNHRNKSLHQ